MQPGTPALGLSPGSGSYRPVISLTAFAELLLCLEGSLLSQQIQCGRGLDSQGGMFRQREMGDVDGVRPQASLWVKYEDNLDHSFPICKSDSLKQ